MVTCVEAVAAVAEEAGIERAAAEIASGSAAAG